MFTLFVQVLLVKQLSALFSARQTYKYFVLYPSIDSRLICSSGNIRARENGAFTFLLNTDGDLRRTLLSDAILDYHDVITRQTRARRFVKLRANASFIPELNAL